MKEIALGILASMFFAVTFILNRSMELAGGSWLWSSSLRFFFMVPLLLLIVLARKNLRELIVAMMKNPFLWIIWSFVGFFLFYAPITFAAAYGPGWLVSGTWQITIVVGVLLGPLFFEQVGSRKVRKTIPLRALAISTFIFLGVILIQFQYIGNFSWNLLLIGVVPVLIASIAYPLGNRKMMEVCNGKLDTFQRVFGMTLATIPFWLVIAAAAYIQVGPPPPSQVLQTFIVAISSGVIATTLFFMATNRVRNDHSKLASVEATQSTQIIFVMIGEALLLSSPLPNVYASIGLGIIILGILLHSLQVKLAAPTSIAKIS